TALYTLSLHDALPIFGDKVRRLESILGEGVEEGDIFTYRGGDYDQFVSDRNGKSLGTAFPQRWELVTTKTKEDDSMEFKVGDKRSEEHTSELQSRENL